MYHLIFNLTVIFLPLRSFIIALIMGSFAISNGGGYAKVIPENPTSTTNRIEIKIPPLFTPFELKKIKNIVLKNSMLRERNTP